jgi:hypothetical protein
MISTKDGVTHNYKDIYLRHLYSAKATPPQRLIFIDIGTNDGSSISGVDFTFCFYVNPHLSPPKYLNNPIFTSAFLRNSTFDESFSKSSGKGKGINIDGSSSAFDKALTKEQRLNRHLFEIYAVEAIP